VIRGDDHVNNTPRQINILRALGAELPLYGHVPMILGAGWRLKLSKRHGAVSVTAVPRRPATCPRRWSTTWRAWAGATATTSCSSRAQMVQWFDGSHLARSPAQWDAAKLAGSTRITSSWTTTALATLVQRQLAARGVQAQDLDHLARACALFKDRCSTTIELADWLQMYFVPVHPAESDVAAHVPPAAEPAIRALRDQFTTLDWTKDAIAAALKAALAAHALKMPQLAPALRVLVCGRAQTPSIDAVLALFTRQQVLERLSRV
jgi:glutamyl-tRNA synthetase